MTIQGTLKWLGATEALWLAAPPTTEIRRTLKVPQLEALYEAAFLRIFTAWEAFVEECLIRLMAGYRTSSYVPVATSGKHLFRTVREARSELYTGRDYLLWHNPTSIEKRSARYLVGSPIELQVRSSRVWLDDIAAVRHRIAHSSDDSHAKFTYASTHLTGTGHRGGPGRLLRATDPADALNPRRWILVFSEELGAIGSRVCG